MLVENIQDEMISSGSGLGGFFNLMAAGTKELSILHLCGIDLRQRKDALLYQTNCCTGAIQAWPYQYPG